MNKQVELALKQLNFRWKAKHLNHIVENIVFKKRNISFLAINVPVQKNDNLRMVEGFLSVAFYLDRHHNIIVLTAYTKSND